MYHDDLSMLMGMGTANGSANTNELYYDNLTYC